MRKLINISDTKENDNSYLKLLRELYVQNEFIFNRMYIFGSKNMFPKHGDLSNILFIDRSDDMAAYYYDDEISQYVAITNRIDEILG